VRLLLLALLGGKRLPPFHSLAHMQAWRGGEEPGGVVQRCQITLTNGPTLAAAPRGLQSIIKAPLLPGSHLRDHPSPSPSEPRAPKLGPHTSSGDPARGIPALPLDDACRGVAD